MKKILIATHGKLASGYLSSIKLLVGPTKDIFIINAYVEDTDIEKDLNTFVNSLREGDKVFVFTDLYGGSVNQKITRFFIENEVLATVISGFNLPVFLGILLASDNISDKEVFEIVEDSRKEIKIINTENTNIMDEEEDFF